MATWKTEEPITSQSRVAVRDADGREGYASVRWHRGRPCLFGVVVSVSRQFDASGAVVGETTTTIDTNPTFA